MHSHTKKGDFISSISNFISQAAKLSQTYAAQENTFQNPSNRSCETLCRVEKDGYTLTTELCRANQNERYTTLKDGKALTYDYKHSTTCHVFQENDKYVSLCKINKQGADADVKSRMTYSVFSSKDDLSRSMQKTCS